jgi:hypothetical protein
MEPKKMGLDFDDFLVKFDLIWQQYHREQYGEEANYHWNFEEGLRRGHEFVRSKHHELIPTVEGAVEAVNILKMRRILIVVTARDELLREPTILLMEKHYPKVFKGVYFLNKNMENVLGSKGDVCAQLGIEEFGDDVVDHVVSTRDRGIRSFLLTTTKNKDTEVEGVIRVSNWGQIVDHVQ